MTIMVKLDSNTFGDFVNSETPTLIMFTGPQCRACESAKQALGRLHLVEVGLVDVHSKLASTWMITTLPTFLLFRNGRLCGRKHGWSNVHKLEEWIIELLQE